MIRELRWASAVPVPRERAFRFFADAANLERITPRELSFRILTPGPIELCAGAEISYRLRLFGIPFSWLTRITAWEPPERFVDEQIRGPFRRWIHAHRFRDCDSGTEIEDHVEYALPFAPVGELAHPLVRRELERIFAYRTRAIEALIR